MIRAVIFDLDDTLYDEREFFAGGFLTVATSLASRGHGQPETTVSMLRRFHEEDRSDVLQRLASVLGFPSAWIPGLAELVRMHSPRLSLFPDAAAALRTLRTRYKLGCITDGWARVQRAKVAALGLESMLDAIVITDELGREFWKPHRRPFDVCCAALGVAAHEALYIGDHPERDLRGAIDAGLAFIRIRRPGAYFARQPSAFVSGEVAGEIESLLDVESRIAAISRTSAASSHHARSD